MNTLSLPLSLPSLLSEGSTVIFGTTALVLLLIVALMIISLWKIFEKAGLAGWKSIVPLYNTYCLVIVAKLPWWCFLLFFVPILNWLIIVYVYYKLSLSFGKSGFYTVGLLLLPIIFFPILAFGDAQYDFTGVGTEGENAIENTMPGSEGEVTPQVAEPVTAPVQAMGVFESTIPQVTAVEAAPETMPQAETTV